MGMFPRPIPDRTITVFATPRPLRVAVILDADAVTAVSDFEQVASYFGRLWGGRYNAIALSHGGELQSGWRRVLELVDADCIYSVSPLTEETVDWINRMCCPAVFRNGDRVTRLEDGQLNVFNMIRETPARITSIPSAIAARTSTLFSPKFFYIHGPAGDDPYKRFLTQNFGVLSEEVSFKDAFRGTDFSDHELANVDAHAFLATLSEHGTFSRFTPDVLSASLATPVTGLGGTYEHQFTLVVGDTIADLALFRAIKMFESDQSGRRCAWIPSALVAMEEVVALIRTWIINSYWTNDNHKIAEVVSLSDPEPDLTRLAASLSNDWQLTAGMRVPAEDLGLPVPSEHFMPAPMRQGMPGLGEAPSTKSYQCGVVDGVGVLNVQVPDFLRHSGREELMLDLEIPYLRNELSKTILRVGGESVWRMPQRQGLAGAFLPSSRLSRIQRHGLPAVVFRGQDPVAFRIPTPDRMFGCSMRNDFISEHDVAGRRTRRFRNWQPSDEGQFLAALIDHFGSPYACGHTLADPFWGQMLRELALGPNITADVTVPSMRMALTRFAEQVGSIDLTTDDGLSEAARFLAQQARASSRKLKSYSRTDMRQAFGRFKNAAPQDHWYWSEADWMNLELDNELDMYVQSETIRMGIQHHCDACLTEQWIPVEGIKSQLQCSGCGARQALGAEPIWRYQINTLVAEAIRRRGVVAVVQALYGAERAPNAISFAAIPSVNVYDGDSNQPFTDLDLVYFANKELVIGEVKANPQGFAESDLTKLAEVAVDLRPNRVVIAAPEGEWPLNIDDLFQRLVTEQEGAGILWEKRNLVW